MKKIEPKATSTPTIGPNVRGRRGIREEDDSIQSPIMQEEFAERFEFRATSKSPVRQNSLNGSSPRKSPRQSLQGSPVYPRERPRTRAMTRNENRANSGNTDTELNSDSDEDYEKREENRFRSSHPREEDDNNKGSLLIYGIVIIAFLVAITALYFNSENEVPIKDESYDLNESFNILEKEFNVLDEDFWQSIKVSIEEISFLKQPGSILFIYEDQNEKILNSIIHKVSQNALCHLSQCSNSAVEIEGASLNTTEIIKDYGKIIVKYRDVLEKNKVLVVRNLEKVPGEAAQAFHFFCDNDNAVVQDALILFTVKVKNLPLNEYPRTFVEKFLLKEWSKIGKDDKFYPLFARISNTILAVRTK